MSFIENLGIVHKFTERDVINNALKNNNLTYHDSTDREASLKRLVPDLFTKKRRVLNIGARTDRFEFGQEFSQGGCEISILEIFPENVKYLKTLDFVSEVYEGDVQTYEFDKPFDCIFWWHGPEHIEKDQLESTLKKIESNATELVVLGCPWGLYKQNEMYENIHERHVSAFHEGDFLKLGYDVECLGKRNVKGSNLTSVKRLS